MSSSTARQMVMDLGEKAFHRRETLSRHLGFACFEALAARPGHRLLVDRTTDRRELNCGKLLAVSLAFARRIEPALEGRKRVGVVFPPGMGAFVANLALVLIDRVPVNLNFTAGRAATEASIRQAEIDTIISTKAVQDRFEDFPWTENTIDLVTELKATSKLTILGYLAAIRLLPARMLARRLGIPEVGDHAEAGLLFSSGSTGEPKGIALTHRNIIGNCEQIAECNLLNPKETMLACLPVFHSFGFTVQLWYPLLHGIRVVTSPSPLEVKKLVTVIREEAVTVHVATPTFFRPFFKRATREDMQSVRYVVAGAEKTPAGFHRQWEDAFGSEYLEGYGLTETSPVVCCNLPATPGEDPRQSLRREKSVGKLFPGMAARIIDPDSRQPKSLYETGILCLRGANVFGGYLGDSERTRQVFDDHWFVTGDLARFDKDGFLYIEGRISRFSKIGGEMVPHGTIEEHLTAALELQEQERPTLAVAGVQDEAKGESLVLLTAIDLSPELIREKLSALGVPNLWIPRRIKRVDEIPCLASGKLDLRALKNLAAQG